MLEREQKENPLERIMRIMGQSEEALLKRKVTYQRINGNIVARVTEQIREGEDEEIEIIKEEDRLLDDNGFPIGKSGVAQAECGCWISLRYSLHSRCPVCRRPICPSHCAYLMGEAVCPSCYKLLRSEMRKRAIKNFFFKRKKNDAASSSTI